MIRRGWVGHCWITRKGDQPNLKPIGHAIEEGADGRGRGADSIRLHVLRLHRTRHVDHENHGGAVPRHERRVLRTSHPDAECGERQEEERERHEPPPVAIADDTRKHVEIREPDRVTHTPALREHVQRQGKRHDKQRQQEQRTFEGHEPPPQTAPTCTTARTPCTAAVERTRTSTRRPCTLRVALTL